MSTGSCVAPSDEKLPFEFADPFLEPELTASSQDQKRLPRMYGKKRLPLKELDLNLERNLSPETPSQTGNPFGPPPSPEFSSQSQLPFEYVVIGPSSVLLPIMRSLLQLQELATCFTVSRDQENHTGLGLKQDWTLTIRTPEQNSGVDTMLRGMLSLTSFEEALTSHICSDGSTVIQFVLNRKELAARSLLQLSGLPPTSTLDPGIKTWTWKLCKLWNDD